MNSTNWKYSDDLEELLSELFFADILQLHNKNKRKSTKAKHERGLTRLQRDRSGEKKDLRMKFHRGSKRRMGFVLRVQPGFIGKLPICPWSYDASIEIDVDPNDNWIELFFVSNETFPRHAWQMLDAATLEEVEIAWVDFDRKKYCWIKIK